MNEDRISVEETAFRLGRSVATIRRWEQEKRIQGLRVLGRLYFLKVEIEEIAKQEKVPEVPQEKKRGRK